jgi:hypothetical protein
MKLTDPDSWRRAYDEGLKDQQAGSPSHARADWDSDYREGYLAGYADGVLEPFDEGEP